MKSRLIYENLKKKINQNKKKKNIFFKKNK